MGHGEEGGGGGPAAFLLGPKPRDFARGEFRLGVAAGSPDLPQPQGAGDDASTLLPPQRGSTSIPS